MQLDTLSDVEELVDAWQIKIKLDTSQKFSRLLKFAKHYIENHVERFESELTVDDLEWIKVWLTESQNAARNLQTQLDHNQYGHQLNFDGV